LLAGFSSYFNFLRNAPGDKMKLIFLWFAIRLPL